MYVIRNSLMKYNFLYFLLMFLLTADKIGNFLYDIIVIGEGIWLETKK